MTLIASRPSRRLGLALAAASLPMFMATLDNLVVTSALPVIHADLGASIESLQWIINAYTLSFAALMLLAVGLGDRFGRRRVFLVGIAVFTAGSAARRAEHRRRDADRGPRAAGRGRRGDHAALAHPAGRVRLHPAAARWPSASGAGSPASAWRSGR